MPNYDSNAVLRRFVLDLSLAFFGGGALSHALRLSWWHGGLTGLGILFIVWACKDYN